ncbi:hypothetical protein MAR_003869, partial [Mya arenaria]
HKGTDHFTAETEIRLRDTDILKLKNEIARLKSKEMAFRLINRQPPKRSAINGHNYPTEQKGNGHCICICNSESCKRCATESGEHCQNNARHQTSRTSNLKRNGENDIPRKYILNKCRTLQYSSSEPNMSRNPEHLRRLPSSKEKKGIDPNYTSLSMPNSPFQKRTSAMKRIDLVN